MKKYLIIDNHFIIEIIITITIVSIVSLVIFYIFNIHIIIGYYDLRIGFPSLDGTIKWMEANPATVTALGIIATIFIFIIQRWLKHREDVINFLNQKYEYIRALYTESLSRKDLLKYSRTDEYNSPIFDFEFPNEIYAKAPLSIQLSLDERAYIMINDFYNTIKMRNKLYNYRREAIVNNLNDPNNYVQPFLINIDKKINEHEEYILKINDDLILALIFNMYSSCSLIFLSILMRKGCT